MTTRSKRTPRKRLITTDDLLRLIFVGDPQMSPDGSTILFTRKHIGKKNNYVLNLWRVPTSGGEPAQFTSGDKDSHGRWSADGKKVAFVRTVKGNGPQVFTIGVEGGEATALTDFPEGTIGTFKWSPDGKFLAVSFRKTDPDWTESADKKREEKGQSTPPRVLDDLWYRLDGDGYFNGQRFHLYLVNAATGEHSRIYGRDKLGFFSFDWSPDSRQLAITSNTDSEALFKSWKDAIYRLDVRTRRVTKVPGLPDGPKDHVLWSPDGKLLAYAGREGEDGTYSTRNLDLWVCDPVKGKARNLTAKNDTCLMAVALTDTSEAVFGPTVRWSPDSRNLLMTLGWHGEAHVGTVRASGGRVKMLTEGELDITLGTLSEDGKRVAMVTASSTEPGEVCVGELKTNGITIRGLTRFNRDLISQLKLSRAESQWIPSEDGTEVQVWTMLPPGKNKSKKMPAVLTVHGGPHAQYGVGFFHEFQVMAAAGYAVFFSNPRGSKGYGEKFCHAIRGNWGTVDWMDVESVGKFIRSRRWVDSGRVGIMGGSYGGYMTNWAIGHTEMFAGAITDRCVSNLVSMGGSSDFPLTPDQYWKGNFWDRPEALWKNSPIQYMGNATTPTLIIHSEGDLRCNIEQSEQVFTLLKTLGVPSRFVRYPRSTFHGMSRGGPPDLRLHRLGQILDWWKKYLG